MDRPDPRLTELLPVFERQARRFARKYAFVLDPDDAAQLALVALWRCAERAPELPTEALAAYAWPRARGSIIDSLRVANGGRRHALQHGAYGFDVATVLGARATGDLPDVASQGPLEENRVEPVCGSLLPDELLSRERLRRVRSASLRARLERLSERQLHVVALFLLGFPQHVVAAALGISAARVSQVLAWFAGRTVKRQPRPRRRRIKAAA